MNRRDVILGVTVLAGCAAMNETSSSRSRPIVIAHRGASAYRPEHTLGAYQLAIEQGADFIEPDLVMTKDHVLVCRHENEISQTTDIADRPEFAERRKTKTVDGTEALGWWVEDFTLAELKTLRCRERIPQLRPGNTQYNDQEAIPTFAEALALSRQHGRGIYPELKHPTFLSEQGLDPTGALISAVREASDGTGDDVQRIVDRMYVQCFEIGPLVTLAQMSSIRWTTIQLMSVSGGPWDQRRKSYAEMMTDGGLAEVAAYARGVGVEKSLILPRGAGDRSIAPTDFVTRAHRRGLLVHAWTFRPENYFLPAELREGGSTDADYMRQHGDLSEELRRVFATGVDGVFSDDPAAAVAAR